MDVNGLPASKMPVNVEGRPMNEGILAVRILWLLTFCMLFLAITTAITGLWLAVAGLSALVVCEAIAPSREAEAGAIEAEVARLRVRLLREHPELF